MKEQPADSPTRLLGAVAVALGLAYIGAYIAIALSRIGYPFELEWMEGGAVDHVGWILAGRPLYGAPSLAFIPYIYTPFYFYLAALISLVTGVGFLPLRLLSFLSSLAILALIALLVRRETRGWRFPLISAGLFAATFRISGAWLDIARVDSLAIALLLLGSYLSLGERSPRWLLLAGLSLGLSFLTKQSTLPAIGAVVLAILVADPRRGLILLLSQAVLIGGSTLLLNAVHHGWYSYYVFELPRRHPILPEVYVQFWIKDLLPHLPLAIALSVPWFVLSRGAAIRGRLFYPLFALAMIGTSYVSRLHEGGYDNVLIPACAALAILAGLGSHALIEWGRRTAPRAGAIAPSLRGRAVPSLCFLAWIVQLAILVYSPGKQIPTKEDEAQGRRLIEMIARVDGEVLMPSHGYLAALAGKETHAQGMAVLDVLRAEKGQIRQRLLEEMHDAIRSRRFGAVIINLVRLRGSHLDYGGLPRIADHYESQRRVFNDETSFWPVTGMPTRPELFLVPKRTGER
ncbi:MAG: hypothetical protein FJY88_02735 [Candidatus Eisenbacteria bacterium]|nr:hypothetical protein [Candidatus Eisenbacteria bacterium]